VSPDRYISPQNALGFELLSALLLLKKAKF